MVAVGAWPVAWAPYGCRGGVAAPQGLIWPRVDEASPLGPVWSLWGRGWSLRPVGRFKGVVGPFGHVWPPLRRGRSPWARMVAVGAWQVTWASYGCSGTWPLSWALYCRRGGMASFLGPFMAVVRAWPVPAAKYGCRGGVAGPLGPVWLPWGH